MKTIMQHIVPTILRMYIISQLLQFATSVYWLANKGQERGLLRLCLQQCILSTCDAHVAAA